MFTPFSDPQERCTQTGAESRVWGRSSAHAMRDSQLFTPRCRYSSLTKHLMKPRHHSAHFSVGCPVGAVTPAVHSAQKRAQAGTAPICHAECTLCDGSRCSSACIARNRLTCAHPHHENFPSQPAQEWSWHTLTGYKFKYFSKRQIFFVLWYKNL